MGNEVGAIVRQSEAGLTDEKGDIAAVSADSPNTSGNPSYVPSDDAKKLYSEYIAEVRKRQLSSSENFDKSILTYSSAGLALSLGFLKDFVPPSLASYSVLLYSSWGLFTAATVITIVSFLISYAAQENMLSRAERYYCKGDESAMSERNWFHVAINALNYSSGFAFVIAIVFTTVFVSLNLEKASIMKKSTFAQDGLPVATMQKVMQQGDMTKGLPPPSMPKVPASSGPISSPGSSTPVSPSTTGNK